MLNPAVYELYNPEYKKKIKYKPKNYLRKLSILSIDTWLSFIPLWGIPVNIYLGSEQNRTSSRKKQDGCLEYISYRFRGYPTKEQAEFLYQNIGAVRFLWNHMLGDYNEELEDGKNPKVKKPTDYKKQEEYSWLKEMDSLALCNAQLNLEGAVSDWKNGTKGKPHFKKKHACKDSYTTNKGSNSDNLFFDGKFLTLPKLKKPIKLKGHRKVMEGATLKSCTITREPNGNWYFSLKYEYIKEDYGYTDNVNKAIQMKDISLLKSTALDMSLPSLYIDMEGKYTFLHK